MRPDSFRPRRHPSITSSSVRDSLYEARPILQVRDDPDAGGRAATSSRGWSRTGPRLSTTTSAWATTSGGNDQPPVCRLEREAIDPELGWDLVKNGHVRRRLAPQHAGGQSTDRLANPVIVRS